MSSRSTCARESLSSRRSRSSTSTQSGVAQSTRLLARALGAKLMYDLLKEGHEKLEQALGTSSTKEYLEHVAGQFSSYLEEGRDDLILEKPKYLVQKSLNEVVPDSFADEQDNELVQKTAQESDTLLDIYDATVDVLREHPEDIYEIKLHWNLAFKKAKYLWTAAYEDHEIHLVELYLMHTGGRMVVDTFEDELAGVRMEINSTYKKRSSEVDLSKIAKKIRNREVVAV